VSDTGTPTCTAEPGAHGTPSTGRAVCRNFGFLAVGRVSANLCAFVFFALLSRAFGQEGIGQYSFATACAGFFAVGADFGLYEFTMRELSRRNGAFGQYYAEIFCVRLLLCLATLGVFFLLLPLVPMLWEVRWVAFIVMLQQTSYTLVDGVLGLCIARGDTHIASLWEVVFRLLAALVGAMVIIAGGSLILALGTQPLITLAQLVTLVRVGGKRYGSLWPTLPTLNTIRQTLHTAVPFALSGALMQLSSRIDILVLAVLLGAAATGVYSAAYRVVFTMLFVPPLIGVSIFPLAAKLYATDPTAVPAFYSKVVNEVLLLALPAAAGLWLIAPKLVPLLFGPDFGDSVPPLRILAWLFLATCYRSVLETFLLSCDLQMTRTKTQWLAAWISVAATILLILGIGVPGAAVATLAAEVTVVLLYVYHLKARIGWPMLDARVAIGVVATGTFFVPLYLHPPESLLLLIVLAVALYVGTLLLFREIRGTEGAFALETFSRIIGRPLAKDEAVSET